jgi:cytosine/adenosine deaminase-related metal-dependent hydrolase
MHEIHASPEEHAATSLHGARCAVGPHDSMRGSIEMADGRLTSIGSDRARSFATTPKCIDIDLSGFLVMPGLVNPHDHLHFALYPNLGNPPYRNYIEWGEDIHTTLADRVTKYQSISKDVRLWWGGIRNLLCGVTTVCHHDPLWPALLRNDFPVRIVRQFGWAHSLALGGDLRKARSATPAGRSFILHACEGTDDRAGQEVSELDRLGVLDASTVLVHGLALDKAGIALMQKRQASLIICPSSNQFLFGRTPDMELLGTMENLALGSDSPLTAAGDLLDEIRFAIQFCGITPDRAYRMVTGIPATILHLELGEGALALLGPADLIAVRDTGDDAGERLRTLTMTDIELVIIQGRVRLASETVYKLLPLQAKHGLEPLWIDGSIRWLRVPVKELLRKAEAVLGFGEARLGGRLIRWPDGSSDVPTVDAKELLVPFGDSESCHS